MKVYLGIDWSETKHDVAWMNEDGLVLARLVIEHSPAGFRKLEETNQALQLGVENVWIGIETDHNLLMDYLWAQHYRQIYVVPPSVVKSSQGRYSSSGSISDPKAAQLIADIVRTDRQRLRLWQPDSRLTRQLQAKVSLILSLTQEVTRLSNRLRAVLLRYYPAALVVFSGGLASQITLTFLQAYPDPGAARQLSREAFAAFAQQQGYPKEQVGKCYARLQADYPRASADTIQIYQAEAQLLAALLLPVAQAELRERRSLAKLFEQHPDHDIFASLPGTGQFLAPALCAKFGDDRQRFPQPGSVQALAGTCPVTEASGKSRWVHFRRGCDREWRQICQWWAKALLANDASPLATAYFDQVRARGHSVSHAYRCVANRWLSVAWQLWQTHTPYDPALHLQHVSAHRKAHS